MPTNLLLAHSEFSAEDSVLASFEGMRVGKSLTIDLTKFGNNADGSKMLRSGDVIADIGNGYGRPLPRARTAAALTTSQNTVTTANARFFIPGDVLTIPTPSARITLGGTWAQNDTATVTVAGQSAVATAGASPTPTTVAAALATAVNNGAVGLLVQAIADGTDVWLFAKSDRAHTVAVSRTGSGTIALAGSATALASGLAIGTIAANGVNVNTNVVTLTGNATNPLPNGAPIGVSGANVAGIVLTPIIFSVMSNDVACYVGATVWETRMPYWDGSLKSALPEIVLI